MILKGWMCPNIVAKHLYEKNGFVIEGVKKNAVLVDGVYIDEFYMAKGKMVYYKLR